LLDPSDPYLKFVADREHLKPISIFRLQDGDFLLCYDAYVAPYIIAYEPYFIEVRHVDTGEIQQIIPTSNLRPLNTNSDSLHAVMDSPTEYQHVFRLRYSQQ
ncbi:RHO1 GDP-GTP exchange protein 2, partial [Quaeritorhiza haematococci]